MDTVAHDTIAPSFTLARLLRSVYPREVRKQEDNAWNDLFRLLDKIPFVAKIQKDSAALRELIQDQEEPRIALVADSRKQANESWHRLQIPPPSAAGEFETVDRYATQIHVGTYLSNDADFAGKIRRIKKRGTHLILCVDPSSLSALGEISEKDFELPPVLFIGDMSGTLSHFSEVVEMDFDHTNSPSLRSAVILALPVQTRFVATRAFGHRTEAQETLMKQIIKTTTTMSSTVGLSPIPFSDAFLLFPLQLFTVGSIAYLARREFSRKAVLEYMTSLGIVGGAAYGLRAAAQQIVKLIPAAGPAVSAGIAGAGTYAIGNAAKKYYLNAELPVESGEK